MRLKLLLFALAFTPCLFILITTTVSAANYYIAPNGSDNNSGLSTSSPLKTFESAWEKIFPGDTLYLMDGTYTPSNSTKTGIVRPNRRDGQPGAPITIKALNDGKAIIDGQYQKIPVQLGQVWAGSDPATVFGNYFVVEGIVAKNSSAMVWWIVGSNSILRRVSGYNANRDTNNHVFGFSGYNNLLEDCVAAGSGRKMILIFQGERRNIIRRCFAGWQEWRGADFCPGHIPWGENIETYNSSYNIIENSIAYGRTPRPGGGINVFGQSGSDAIGNRVYGSIAMNVGLNWNSSTIIWPCPYPDSSCTTCWSPNWLHHRSGFGLGNPNGGSINNNVFQDIFSYSSGGLGFNVNVPSSGTQNQMIRATLVNNGVATNVMAQGCANPDDLRCEKNRSIQLPKLTAFSVFQDNKIQCTSAQEPSCGGSGFKGQGAKIKYRYESYFDANNNPVINLTDIPLWPWPMEERIMEEFKTHLTMYHAQTPELANFSVTNTIVPILQQHGAMDGSTPTPTNTSTTNTPTPTPEPGDANGDGKVDGLDYVIWLNNYGTTTTDGASKGDFNADGRVDGLDYVIWLNNYGT
jgi:hypothetical protein